MHDSGRRIKKLRITSNDETVINSQVNALEDAFRIASFPGLPPNGLVMIRRLDLGCFNVTVSPMMLAQLIDKKIQYIARLAVCVDEEEHPEANVVWFSDHVQSLMTFLILLLENKTPIAWYWKLQVPAWHPGMNFLQSLSCVMQTTIDETSGRMVGCEIIQLLMNYGKVEQIFSVLTTQLAIQLLNEANYFPQLLRKNIQVTHSKIEIMQNLNAGWLTIITRAVEYWGEDDPRTLWLTYTTLVKHNPCLENSDEISQVITRLIYLFSHEKAVRMQGEIMRHGVDEVDGTKVEREVENNKPLIPVPFTGKYSVEIADQNNQEGSHVSEEPGFVDKHSTLLNSDENPLGKGLNDSAQKPALYQIKDNPKNLMFSVEASGLADKIVIDNEESADLITQKDIETTRYEVDQLENDFQTVGYGFQFSAYSGLSFIIPLLEYIGIQEMLILNPWMAEINFPGRIIKAVASRIGISKCDPVFKMVAELPDYSDLEGIQFISPAIWESLVYWPNGNNKMACRFMTTGGNQSCFITDKSRRFLLYVGDTGGEVMPIWLSNICIIDMPGVFSTPGLADLEMSTQLLFGKFLRHYAKTGLRQLMQREGQIAITKTHLDILFDSRLVDNFIRSAGLDINLGWVSWFGKVVEFHYDYESYTHV